MRNVLIILGLTAALAAAGWVGTMMVAQRQQKAAAEQADRPVTGDHMKDMAESQRQMSRASGDLSKRQTWAMIGGGVGAAVGLVLGLIIVSRLDRKTPRPVR